MKIGKLRVVYQPSDQNLPEGKTDGQLNSIRQ